MNVAVGTQRFLPYTQSWIYRQMKGARVNIALVICNQVENLAEFPFEHIAVVSDNRSLLWRKVVYKLQPVLKYFPFVLSQEKQSAYTQALKKHQITVMHAHFGVMGVELMSACKALHIPLIVTFHGFDITAAVYRDPSYRKALLQLFDRMKFGLAISEEMKERLIHLGCPVDKIIVSYLGIPLNEFNFVDRSKAKDTVTFLHAGRFSATKGVPDLIRSFSSAFTVDENVALIIAGDGEEKPLVLQAIEASPLKDKIQFLGKVSNEKLEQCRSHADVFVLNCRTPLSGDKEGLPIALLEASCTGLPIVTTRHSGISEGVLHERTGLLVDECDNDALSVALRRMMDQSLRLTLGKQGRQWMEKQFDLVQCNEALYKIYEKAQ